MPTKSNTEIELTGGAPSIGVELPPELRDRLSDEVIDQLLAGVCSEEEIVGPGGVLAQPQRGFSRTKRSTSCRAERKSPDVRGFCRALFRTRTGDPLLTMEVLYQLS